MVAWMLTSDDGSSDGKFVSYLDNPQKWSIHDRPLYEELRHILSGNTKRQVKLIEETTLLGGAHYFSDSVPDLATARNDWFSFLLSQIDPIDIVFLDPDNGLEIKSRPYGTVKSSKFVYWREIESLWSKGKSLLIYQHFIREKRIDFIGRMLVTLHTKTPNSLVEAFSTPHVVFFMALQPEHQHFHQKIVISVQKNWAGQIKHWELTQDLAVTEDVLATSSLKA